MYSWQRFSPVLQASSSQGLIVSLALLNLLSFMKSHFSIVSPNSWGNYSGNSFQHLYHIEFCLCFLLAVLVFQVSDLGLWCIWSYFLCQVINTVLISFFWMWTSSFHITICWRCFFFSLWFCCLCQINVWSYMYSFLSSILFHCSWCQSLCHYLMVFISMALYYVLDLEWISLQQVFLFRIVLAIWGLLWFHVNFRVAFYVFIFVKNEMRIFDWDYIESESIFQ